MKYILTIIIVSLLINNKSSAKSAKICNHAPFKIFLAVAYKENRNYMSQGWYHLEPAECHTRSVSDKYIYYHAESDQSNLVKWLFGKKQLFSGLIPWNRFCIESNAFNFSKASGRCAYKRIFIKESINNTIFIHAKNHEHLKTDEHVLEARRMLIGRMNLETHLRSTSDRESAFQLGFLSSDNPEFYGAEVTHVFAGTPAESIGILKGDIITRIDGRQIDHAHQINDRLDRLDIFHSKPLNIEFVRGNDVFLDVVDLLFFEFGWKTYTNRLVKNKHLRTSFINAAGLGLGNEIRCATKNLFSEGVDSISPHIDFDFSDVSRNTGKCSRVLNRELKISRILWPSQTELSEWASLMVPLPGAKLLTMGKSTKGLKFANKHRKLAFPNR